MKKTIHLDQCQEILFKASHKKKTIEERSALAVELASLLLMEAKKSETTKERKIQHQLARMMKDPMGKAFTTEMTDQCFRSQDASRAADQIVYLLKKYGIPKYLSRVKRGGFWIFKTVGKYIPQLMIPVFKWMIRKETKRVILPGEMPSMLHHIRDRQEAGIRINLNHLGEAILGEEEVNQRMQVYLKDLAHPEIDYISIKISTICSQLNLLAWEETLEILAERLRTMYRAAKEYEFVRANGVKAGKFVNLDMEEYRDLALTTAVFKKVLDEPEFLSFSAGIVLQSYIPDAFLIQKELTAWALMRKSRGGAPIKIRIVKGANLAMEKLEAALKGWPQAPYHHKYETDANFKRMLEFGCRIENVEAVHLGIGSHNLLDIAYAMLLRAENGSEKGVGFEMLEGMAEPLQRIVHQLTGSMLLYCPVAKADEFQNAIAYLIRRLDENTAPENFLRDLFELHPDSKAWMTQVSFFRKSCQASTSLNEKPKRDQNRFERQTEFDQKGFRNEPDTDWSLDKNRKWAQEIIQAWKKTTCEPVPLVIGGTVIQTALQKKGNDPSLPGKDLFSYSLAQEKEIELSIKTAKEAEERWDNTKIAERVKLLTNTAQKIRDGRDRLIGVMLAHTGKTISEGDMEVSEAIDFLEYYSENAMEWMSLEDIQWRPKGTILVTPPWNFPCSIPIGAIAAALIVGNCVIFKPAQEAVLVGWEIVNCFWQAGISKDVLQFVICEDEPYGSLLVKDNRVNAVLLTGGTETALHMLRLRADLDLIAETGGKNAMIVTSMADRDLAIKDLIHSAFSYAGQKCSACSLAILEAEVYDDLHFRRQLCDAVKSLFVGSAWEMSTKMNPLIRAPSPFLKRGLTQLEEGEEWLLKPTQNKYNPNLWTPGIKIGVSSGSFTHQNELFGPVLGLMRADNLTHAIQLANHTPYGLTAGIHTLDEREQLQWVNTMIAGNCYINRGMTGAIVRRQPFGGCKRSSFGLGAKTGGPNYVTQLMIAKQHHLPQQHSSIPAILETLNKNAKFEFSEEDYQIWIASVANYAFYWENHFKRDHDHENLPGQDNLFRYLPHESLVLRIQKNDVKLDVMRAVAAARICARNVHVSYDNKQSLFSFKTVWWREGDGIKLVQETDDQLMDAMQKEEVRRIRLLSPPSEKIQQKAAKTGCCLRQQPVLANGRLELLHYLREVSISRDYHRYGHLEEQNGSWRDKKQTGIP